MAYGYPDPKWQEYDAELEARIVELLKGGEMGFWKLIHSLEGRAKHPQVLAAVTAMNKRGVIRRTRSGSIRLRENWRTPNRAAVHINPGQFRPGYIGHASF